MKIKINWGTGITIAIILMISGMLTLVYVATRQNFDLVEKDYYQKGINFQEQIESRRHTLDLEEQPELWVENNLISLEFPNLFIDQILEGKIHFYSSVNADYDLIVDLKLNEEMKQTINIDKLKKGRYTIKLNWTADHIDYYLEKNITTN